MQNTIYDDEAFGINTFKREITKELGEKAWEEITRDGIIPIMETEAKCGCRNMAIFMDRFDRIADKKTTNRILSRVRHGLNVSQHAWAREKFLKIGNLDEFIKQNIDESIVEFERLFNENQDFYGDEITKDVLDFLKLNTGILCAQRKGNQLNLFNFPHQMHNFIHAKDNRMKRYYACHCQFAKESILAEKTVSSTLCYCSLGHAKNYWEAIFDRELDGEILTSVLKGDLNCSFVLYLPDDIMALYVN